ncbi:hypothetical protein HMPREF0083_03667 [Aneurinibacillus aneurinilyticus ATCC 12856]|uniref:Uncharacterized protein n=1 Tax=Aneurinibacillus aneurinilyticus ATCC 12856 TaxID=649747 RepID=U1Y7X2_ANEAE|nr:hypothetical protein HMPREF0083_03667 [Aneurinibacillus aneurinilyticus ATCC 12856]
MFPEKVFLFHNSPQFLDICAAFSMYSRKQGKIAKEDTHHGFL